MDSYDVATAFFHACEGLEGWTGCRQYVADGATFSAQSEPVADLSTVEEYCEWMAGLGAGPLAGCRYELHCTGWDDAKQSALYFATFHGQHVGEGGPVEATQQHTHSHYVYVLQMNSDGKVAHMTKIWNAPWALAELGWS